MLVLMGVWLKNPRWDNCSSKFFGKKLPSCRFPKYYPRTPSIINTLTWGIPAFETLSWETSQASLTAKGVHYGHGRVITWKLGPVLCGRSQACSHLRPTCCASVRSSLFPVTDCPDTLLPQVSFRCHLPREGSPDRLWKITPPTPSLHFIFVIAPARRSPTFWNVSAPSLDQSSLSTEEGKGLLCTAIPHYWEQ